MRNEVKHYGMLGMHWGVTTGGKSGGRGGGRNGGKSHFRRSVEQKYGKPKAFVHNKTTKKVTDILTATGKNALGAAGAFVAVYGTMAVSQLIVESLPKIAWATGKIIKNSPL